MNILFVSAYVPSRIRVRPYSFINTLAGRGHSITLVCGATRGDTDALDEMRGVCGRVIAVPMGKATLASNALRALPTALPLQAALNFAPRMLAAVQRETRSGFYDVAHIEHLRASAFGYGTLGLPTVFDSVDCISLLFERALRGSPSFKSRALALLDLPRTRAYEAQYVERFERVLVTSEEDAWALETLRAGQPATNAPVVIPNGVDLHYFTPSTAQRLPATLVFSGKMSYHANAAAALFLGRQIKPRVWAQRPDVRLTLVGSAPGREVQALATDTRISVTGYVADMRPYLSQATIAVAPLRYAVGIQNKVLEAMAMGTPVVAARQITRSMHPHAVNALRAAEHASEYAQAVLELLEQPEERARLSIAGHDYVERQHDWGRVTARLEAVYQEAINGASRVPLAHRSTIYTV